MNVVHVYEPIATNHHERMLRADEKRIASRHRIWKREDKIAGRSTAKSRKLTKSERQAINHMVLAASAVLALCVYKLLV